MNTFLLPNPLQCITTTSNRVTIVLPIHQTLCPLQKRPDGSLRASLPWRPVESPHDSVKLGTWMGSWLQDAPRTEGDLPLVFLFGASGANFTQQKLVWIEAYQPKTGKVYASWCVGWNGCFCVGQSSNAISL